MRLKEYPIGDYVGKCQTWNPKSSGVGSFDYIDLSSVDKSTKSIVSIERYECSDAPSRARQLVEADDVLVATVRPNLNGVALINGAHHGMTASTGYCVLRPDKDKLYSRFLFHWVKTGMFVQRMVDVATGANYPAVSAAKVKASKIPLPPLAEQKRIARILDAADALRAKRREALALLDTLLQSTFLDMFGDPVTNPMRWKKVTIKEVTTCLDRFRQPVKKADRVYGNVPYYGANGQQGWINEALFDEPLVLVAEDGGHFGDPARGVAYRIDGPSWVNNHAHVLRPAETIDIEYLHCALRHYDFGPYISGSTRDKLNQKQLNRARILFPPLAPQRRFASIVESVKQQKDCQRAHLAELDTLFASLQARAFRGDL